MQDIPQETLSETTKAEQSAKVDLWEFDLTAIGGERFFFCNEPNEKGEPLTWQGRQYEPYPIQVSGGCAARRRADLLFWFTDAQSCGDLLRQR